MEIDLCVPIPTTFFEMGQMKMRNDTNCHFLMNPKNIEEYVSKKVLDYANQLDELKQQMEAIKKNFHTQNTIYCTLFYANRCLHSQKTLPEWISFMKHCDTTNVGNVMISVAHIECGSDDECCTHENILGFPTFKFKWRDIVIIYNGKRKMKYFEKYLFEFYCTHVKPKSCTTDPSFVEFCNDNINDF